MKVSVGITISVPNTLLPMLADMAFRIGISILYGYKEATLRDKADAAFLPQVILYAYPFLLTGFFILRDRWVDRVRKIRFERMKNKFAAPIAFKNHIGPGVYSLVLLALIHFFALIYFISDEQAVKNYLLIGLHLGYLASTIFLFSRGIFNEKQVQKTVEAHTDKWDDPSADDNNEHIIGLESRLTSIQQRLEGYILESALLGGLAFSGFLQILSQNIITVNDLTDFGRHVADLFRYAVKGNGAALMNILSQMTDHKDLFCLMSAQSLVCSVFFLLVIASRLRYSDLSDKIRHSLALAHDANEKEDHLFTDSENLSDFNRQRLELFSRKVTEALDSARQTFVLLAPVLEFMRLFRNLGVATFFIVVLTGALFIAGWLTVFCAVLFVTAQLYFRREEYRDLARKAAQLIRHFLDEYNIHLPAGAIALFVSGHAVTFWGYTTAGISLASAGCAVLILSRQLNLWIRPDEPSNDHFWNHQKVRSLILRSVSLFGEGLICVALVVRMTGNEEAFQELFTFGLLFLLYYIVGFVSSLPYSLPFRILTGTGLFWVCLGLFLKLKNTPGGDLLIISGNFILSFGVLFSFKQMKFIRWAKWLILLFFFAAPQNFIFNAMYLPGMEITGLITFGSGMLAFGTSVYFISGKRPYKYLLFACITGWFLGFIAEEINRDLWAWGFILQIGAFLLFLFLESRWTLTGFNFQRGLIVRYVIIITFFFQITEFTALNYLYHKIKYPNSLIINYREYHHFFGEVSFYHLPQAQVSAHFAKVNSQIEKWKRMKKNKEYYISDIDIAHLIRHQSTGFRENFKLKSVKTAEDTIYALEVIKWTAYAVELSHNQDLFFVENHIEQLSLLGGNCKEITLWSQKGLKNKKSDEEQKKWFQEQIKKCAGKED